MTTGITSLFWDSCVFYAFLGDEQHAYDIASIEQYLQEAKAGKCRIYASSLVFAEVTPSAITRPTIGTFQDFVDDLQGAVSIIDPTPNVMHLAGRLRDLPYKKGNSAGRRLSTTDAIMLAGCVHLRDVYRVDVSEFHTFDNGKKRGPEGKMVPLISYEDWCTSFTPDQMQTAGLVTRLNRRTPIHPQPKLSLSGPPNPT